MANPKSKKKKKIFTFSLIIIVIATLTVAAIFKKKEAVISIEKEKVARRNLTELVVANGKIQPVVQVKLSPEVSGEIIELPFKEGQHVKKGDVLIKIKPDPYTASKNSAEANYKYSMANRETADANLEKADLEFKRQHELHLSKLISDSDRQTAKTSFDVAKATLLGAAQQVEMAQASLARAEDDLSKTTIFSPIDGTVTKLYSEVGERVVGTATMAGTDIMIVSDLNAMEARVDIGEVDVVLIKVGQNVQLEVDAFKDRKFKGVVTEVANSSKNATAGNSAAAAAASSASQDATKFEVRIRVAEKEDFRPGMSVTANIETRSRTNALAVPIQSVTTRLPKPILIAGSSTNSTALATNEVKVADRKKPGEPAKPTEVVFIIEGDHVKMTPVKRGIADDNYVEIVDGLKEDQEVVSGGSKAINRDLEDDKKVVVASAKTEFVKEAK
ncbi:MAG: Efflux transporter, family, subunit [Pedosphaera sp.]|nr:Efflux transporter, family, subunit [Pedosphaera sp.]